MDLFTQKRFGTWAIVLLVALNLLALGTLWWTQVQAPLPLPPIDQPVDGDPGGMAELPDVLPFIAREIHLSQTQHEQIRTLREDALPQIRRQWQEMHALRRQLHEAMFSDTTDPNQLQTWSKRIGELQSELEWTKIDHLLQIKALCSPKQQQRLQALLEEVMQRTRPPGRPGHGGPGGLGRRGMGMGRGGPGRGGQGYGPGPKSPPPMHSDDSGPYQPD